MKILLLASGKSYHAVRWANALSERGIEVGFASVHKVERPVSEKVKVFQLSTRGGVGYLLDIHKLKLVIEEWQPDVLHAHYATGYGFMSKLSGFKKRIVSIYGADIYNFPYKSPFHRLLLSFFLTGASRVLSTSESMANEYLKVYPKFSRPIVTPFGVDKCRFKPNLLPKKTASSLNIGIVKKLEKKYGIDVLIKAFKILKAYFPELNIHLHIAGPGTQSNELKRLVFSFGLQECVTFYGAIQNADVPALLVQWDVFVVPSRCESESFGVAAVEAQACGLPVVASDVGGLPEVVVHNETGLIVPKEDPVALANALKFLCDDVSCRQKFGQAGRERVMKLYDWEKNVEHMIRIYYQTI